MEDKENTTIAVVLEKAKQLFFPDGKSKKGPLNKMVVEMGDFKQTKMDTFKDPEGNEESFETCLKRNGLNSTTRYHLYLMTTSDDGTANDENLLRREENQGSYKSNTGNHTSDKDNQKLCEDDRNPMVNDVMIGNFQQPSQIFPKSHSQSQQVLCPLFVLEAGKKSDPAQWIQAHSISIQYELSKNSRYSDKEVRIVVRSRQGCYDVVARDDVQLLETPLHKFQPPEEGFIVSEIEKGGQTFLKMSYFGQLDDTLVTSAAMASSPPAAVLKFEEEFPSVISATPDKLILHQPSEIWGYDQTELVIGVVVSCKLESTVFEWCCNGKLVKKAIGLCCLAQY